MPGERPGALVLGANLRSLAVARSLGRRGIAVWIMREPDDDPVACVSRHVRRTLSSSLAVDDESWAETLLSTASRHGLRGWTLFPTADESSAAVARAHARLAASFTFTSPPWEIARQAHHKRLAYDLAERAGVERPWTRYPASLEDVEALRCTFPVVLKPDVKASENSFTRAKAWRVDDRASLLYRWREAVALVGVQAVMVQELIPARANAQYSYAALCREGEVLASLVARRTRQYPRDFGHSSSMVETVDAPAIEQRGEALVSALRWSGLVEVELMHDPRDDTYKLLDVNGRVWTWHGLGARAGVDFPYLAWRLAQGLPVERVRALPEVRWVRLATDVPSAVGAIRAGELSTRDWIASLRRPRVGAVLARDDLLPALADPLLTAWRSARRRSQAHRKAAHARVGAQAADGAQAPGVPAGPAGRPTPSR